MRRASSLAVGLGLLSLATLAGAASPSLESAPTTPTVQKFVDSLLRIGEVQKAFVDGDVVKVSSGGNGRWAGNVRGGAVVLESGNPPATHTLVVDESAMLSIINAYDVGNTAKLAVKAQHMVADSMRPSVMTAIGAVARTPLDDRLPTKTPTAGDAITFQGCTGTLSATDDGRFKVHLCEDDYLVNSLGGVTAKLPRPHLQMVTPAVLTLIDDDYNPEFFMISTESYGASDSVYSYCRSTHEDAPERRDYESEAEHATALRVWNVSFDGCLYLAGGWL